MDAYRFLAAVLFFYEVFRILFLVILLFISPQETSLSAILPVYISSNALFPLMALFVWLRPLEHRNYLTLYIAGKIIIVVSFFAWQFFSSWDFVWFPDTVRIILVLGAYILLNFTDILSVWGAWAIKNRYKRSDI
jgi:hypothetical protein